MSAVRSPWSILPLVALAVWACEGEGPVAPDPVASVIEVGIGGSQHGVVGVALAQPVVFAVYDDSDNGVLPVAGVSVTVDVVSGGGSVDGGSYVTDDDGLVSVIWTLGTVAGEQVIRASIGVDTALATATAHAGPVAAIEKVDGDEQSGAAGSTLDAPLTVRLTDAFGNPVANVVLAWTTADGGTLAPTESITDHAGLASATWQLGSAAGSQSATATSGSASATFTATATAGAFASLQIVSGNAQTDTVGTELTDALVVRAVDAAGNPVAGVPLTFVVTSGGGSLFVGSTTTNSEGLALERWTLGTSTAVEQRVEARAITASGAPQSVQFSATAIAATPVELIPQSSNVTDTVGQTLPDPIAVQVRDQYGNPVQAALVTWSVLDGGSVSATQGISNASGTASVAWTLGTIAGAQRVQASIAADADTFTATAVAGPPASIERVSGDDQYGTVAQSLPDQIVVRVTDAFGNPVGDREIEFILPPNSSIPTPGPYTDQNGVARATWVLGTVAGIQYAVAYVDGDSTTFQAHAAPGPVSSVAISPEGATLTSVGDTVRFHAAMRDVYGNPVEGGIIWSTVDAGVATVSDGLVTAQNQGLVGIRAMSENGVADIALVTVPVLGSERLLEVPALNAPTKYQMVGDYLLYQQPIVGSSVTRETVLRRISTMEQLWRFTSGDAVIALGDRFATVSVGGNVYTHDILTGVSSTVDDVYGEYRATTSGDWIAYEAWSGGGRVVDFQSIRVQNILTGQLLIVTTSDFSSLTGRECGGRPLFDYPYLVYSDSSRIKVYDVETETVHPGPGGGNNLSMSGNRASWTESGEIEIFEVANAAWTISENGNCAAISGDLLTWTWDGNAYLHRFPPGMLSGGSTQRVTYTTTISENSVSLDAGRLLFLSEASGDLRFHLFEPY